MHLINQSAFLKSLGWTLLNSFWQFGILWIIFLSIITFRKELTPQVKHGLALAFLAVGFAWSGAGLSYQYFSYLESGTSTYLASNVIHSRLYITVTEFLEQNLSYLSAAYLLVVAALFLNFFRYFYFSHKIQTTGLIKMKASLRLYVEQVCVQLGISRKVNVWLSQYVDTPIIVGFLRPTILIPVACMTNLSARQLEAILLHELAHIKRNDYLVNLFMAAVEIIFFFNPFSRLFIRSIKLERENCCDDQVMQFRFERHQYASALLALERNRSAYFHLAIASTGGGRKTLLHRIQRILEMKKKEETQPARFVGCVLAVFLFAFVALFNPADVVFKNLSPEVGVIPAALNRSIESPAKVTNEQLPATPEEVVEHIEDQSLEGLAEEEYRDFEPEESPLEDQLHVIQVSQPAFGGIDVTTQFVLAVHTEVREFSKTDNLTPVIPEIAEVYSFPYVPSSSYSFVCIDTTKPKVKAESYAERDARESLLKAKKALEEINWEKIEKVIDKQTDIAKIKAEIQLHLEKVNWQQINDEVKQTINNENIAKLKALQDEVREARLYKAQQLELRQLQERVEHHKELNKRALRNQTLQLQKEMIEQQQQRKKVIVNI